MKVLLINGSPRKDGCTNRALEEVASTLEKEGIEAEIYWIGNKAIEGCLACQYCSNHNGNCVFNDQVNEIANKVNIYDGFIFGSPVYYANPSGPLMNFMQRLFYSSGAKLQYKVGASVVSSRRAGSTTAFDVINKYFTINNMPIVSSNYWNEVHGSNKAQVEQDIEGLQTMRILAKNMAWLLKSIEAGKKANIEIPEKEKRIATNFIR